MGGLYGAAGTVYLEGGDDGDGSGDPGDNPCPPGVTVNCDDNCPFTGNPQQGDSDGDGGRGLTHSPGAYAVDAARPGCRSFSSLSGNSFKE